ncbi:class I SAM-dependent methyltransferase [Moorena sp. SIO3H5]|uniref:class I SAM-dependent methyltransferase n=1 Tax=Moorena sp. SIO3H5 TaxID=2607834 RepID=UPI0013BA4024|nr:class I SAM-dependent methyltransferase [Moorena sp. SIO3H5]NEO69739.1 class I SAM-dependent methyltransferase [Moorena sp. SIO3H5]
MLELLTEIQNTWQDIVLPVDKRKDCWTVSQQFRDHVKQFFPKKKSTLLEVGCYKGMTAKHLADHFTQYLGLDVNDRYLRVARLNNIFNSHVKFQKFDVYTSDWNQLTFPADVVLIDARHKYEYIKQDIDNCLKRFNHALIIFDDYGAWESVYRAVNEAIDDGKLEVVKEIGVEKGQQLWPDQNNPYSYTHFGSEGLICRSSRAVFN